MKQTEKEDCALHFPGRKLISNTPRNPTDGIWFLKWCGLVHQDQNSKLSKTDKSVKESINRSGRLVCSRTAGTGYPRIAAALGIWGRLERAGAVSLYDAMLTRDCSADNQMFRSRPWHRAWKRTWPVGKRKGSCTISKKRGEERLICKPLRCAFSPICHSCSTCGVATGHEGSK